MSRSSWTRAVVVLLVAMMGFTALLLSWPRASAATKTWDTDVDFNAGTLNGVEVIGTGTPATMQLLKDATDWANENPASSPGMREGPVMVYDSTHDLVVLFGGYDGAYLGDTWEYDPGTNTWSQTSSTGPSGRELSGISFDSANGLVVLFGGISNAGFENDTWEYDAATNGWTQRTPSPAPPPMASYQMTFDSAGGVSRSILTGYNILNGQMVTWAYDAGAHTWANRNPSPNIPTRTNFAMGYHANFARVVAFGGLNPVPPPGSLQSDTWEYNYGTNQWTQTTTTGPSARTSAGTSYRATENALYLFGGIGTGAPFADTWEYLLIGGQHLWATVFVQNSPPARSMFGMADQAANTKSYIFGGVLAGGGYASDTWGFGPAFRTFGTWRSPVFDSGGANAVWNTISWVPTSQPASTSLDFQLAVSNDPNLPDLNWSFYGPSCDYAQYFTSSPSVISPCFNNFRYLRVLPRFISFDDTVTPTLDSVTIDYTVPPLAPYIVVTDPPAGPNPVPQTKPIFIRFSEQINTANFAYTITPSIATTKTWTEGDSAVTLDHTALLSECQQYTVDITYAEDMNGNTLIPNPLDPSVTNPFTFVTECVHPWVVATNPAQDDTDVLVNAPVVIDFSEGMNTTSVNVVFTPNLSPLSYAWSNGNTRLTVTHTTPFGDCVVYTATVTGLDLAGLDLVPGPVPNPWTFTSHCAVPFIRTTSPVNMEIGVVVTRNIVVVFSEPMVPASLVGKIAISPGITLTPNWSNNNQTLTLTHATPLTGCTPYTVNVTGGVDADEGLTLFPGQAPGGAPHPWQFMTVCPNPFILVELPDDGSTGVDPTMNITIAFSEAMDVNPFAFSYTITPRIPLVATWTAGNQLLTLSHVSPFACGQNTVQVAGNDSDQGLPLVPGFAPNPFRFVPLCPNPFIIDTVPADDDIDVALMQDIVVTFSTQMNRTSVTYGALPTVTFDPPVWSNGDTVLTLSHASSPFLQSTQYVMQVGGEDTAGNPLVAGAVPNPWRFTTVGVNPQILSTDPPDQATGVGTSSNVVITFSKAMNTTSVVVTPAPFLVLGTTWSAGDTVLTLSHITPFNECTQYQFQVTGTDTAGNPLIPGPAPNPWVFTTVCFAPYITDTNPVDGATGVGTGLPIWLNFSKSMNTVTVQVTSVPLLAYTLTWSNGDQTARAAHATAFAECTTYTVTVTGRDTSGNNLVAGPVPNPWSFTTNCPSPYIASTNPVNGQTNVPTTFQITITFSRAMDTPSVVVTLTPPATGTTTRTWIGGDTILTLSFSQPQSECTTYSVLVQGNATNGQPLGPGPVPNPWSFDTICSVPPPGGLTVTRVAPTTIHLAWSAVPNATSYRVYEAQNRFASFPSAWNVRGNPAGTTFDAPGDLTDGNPHFYIVRAMRGATLSANSTMGVKIQMNVGFNAAGPNVRWFSLPYRSEFVRASDIVRDIEGTTMGHTKIDVIARWNPATQSSDVFAWFRGGWRGNDFTINAADGMWFNSVSVFSWVVVGTDRATTLTFTVNAPPLGNTNWRGIPYTGTYTRASDLVRDIEGNIGPGANTKILEVVRWDSATQTYQRYQWAPSGWGGNDFTIGPGDGIYFRIVASFTWQPRLVTPEVP